MDLTTAFLSIHWLSVVVATLAAFAVGALWYSPVMFGNLWQREIGLSNEEIQNASMPLIFGTSFVLNLIAAIVLEMLLGSAATAISGLMAVLLVGVAWVATAMGTTYLFARKSLKLYFIDAGYFVVYYPLMGLILGLWK